MTEDQVRKIVREEIAAALRYTAIKATYKGTAHDADVSKLTPGYLAISDIMGGVGVTAGHEIEHCPDGLTMHEFWNGAV